ncbi:MAG: outer membrane protein assembly factor BamE [Gammaproteobacteria bacterium]|nr:outer membrane protein assembly factor BamE [Gammaproteobacteria bacterium]
MKKITLVVLLLPFLSACSPSMPELPEMPKMPKMPKMSGLIPDISLPTLFIADVNQGSILDRFSINQLKVGMSKTQVQDLIGSPSVTDPFHNNQWDYINHSTLYEKDSISYRLTLIFDKNKLKDIDDSKLNSLPPLTEKEQELENKRLAKEKIIADRAAKAKAQASAKKFEKAKSVARAKAVADKKAAAQAKILKEKQAAQAKSAAKAKAVADKKASDKAKALAKKRAADERKLKEKQAAQKKEATREADLKEGYEIYKKAEEKAKSLKGLDTPWYRFW